MEEKKNDVTIRDKLKNSFSSFFARKARKDETIISRSLPGSATTSPRNFELGIERHLNVQSLIAMSQNLQLSEQKEKYLPHLKNFIEDIQPALVELINLCGIISSKYFVSEDENEKHSDDPRHKHTIFSINELVKGLHSTFITDKLYKPLENASDVEKTKFKKEFLDTWRNVELQKPKGDPTFFNMVIHPKKESTTFYDSETLKTDPLTLSKLLRATDKEIFFRINAYHLPGVGGTRSRSAYEHCILEFLKKFIEYIQHPDFEGLKGKEPKPFEDWGAYQFYFIDEMIRVIVLLTQYVLEVIDNAYDIIYDGWSKIRFICQSTNMIELQTQPYFEEIENKLRILGVLRRDGVFDDLRTSLFDEAEKKGQEIKPKTEKEMDEKTNSKFGDIIVRTEIFDMDSAPGASWEMLINNVQQHRPKGKEEMPELSKICESVLYCIDSAKNPINKIKPLLDRNTNRKCRFYISYTSIVEEFNQVKDNPNFGMIFGGHEIISPRKLVEGNSNNNNVQIKGSMARVKSHDDFLHDGLDDDTEEEIHQSLGRRNMKKNGLTVVSVPSSKVSRKRIEDRRRKSTGNLDYANLLNVIRNEKKESKEGRKTPVASPRGNEIRKK